MKQKISKAVAILTEQEIDRRPTMKDVASYVNRLAMNGTLKRYRDGKADHTLRRQSYDLALFMHYLTDDDGAGLYVGNLYEDLSAWAGCEHGLVLGFREWMIEQGFSVGTINVRLSTVKRYAQLATDAGYIPIEAMALIKEVKGFTYKEALHLDGRREVTRVGKKKATPTHIEYEQAIQLKSLPDSRDALLMCLLLDHGLRVSEVAGLMVENMQPDDGLFEFFRPKVAMTQKHNFTADTLQAFKDYAEEYGKCPGEKLFMAEGENGKTVDGSLGNNRDWVPRAIAFHVAVLGRRVGIEGLSPHDCRHYWATRAIKRGTDIKALQDAGGWKSPHMPLRYAESAKIANEGVIL